MGGQGSCYKELRGPRGCWSCSVFWSGCCLHRYILFGNIRPAAHGAPFIHTSDYNKIDVETTAWWSARESVGALNNIYLKKKKKCWGLGALESGARSGEMGPPAWLTSAAPGGAAPRAADARGGE